MSVIAMPKKIEIEAAARSRAPVDQVWRLVEDVTTWSSWGDWSSAAYEEPGHPGPHGVGALRRLERGRLVNRERVVDVVPERLLRYELVSGLPLVGYRAAIELAPDGSGTAIRWRASYDPTIRGRMLRWPLQRFFRQGARRLADAASAGTAGTGEPSS